MTEDIEQQLQRHARCVRSLASAMLDDYAAGEDIAQETLLAASQKAPPAATSMRAWMLQVGRRLANRWRRTEARRLRREQANARAEGLLSAADEAARAEQLQAIATAVAALPPPLREVIMLRHYDDLPPRAIAARLSLSVEAVESRLRRARERLRATLRRHAADGDLRAGLLLLTGHGAWTTLPGVVAMTMKSKSLLVAAALLLLLTTGALLLWRNAAVDAPGARTPVAAFVVADAPPAAAVAVVRTDAASAVTSAPESDLRPSWSAQVTGRVVDERRHPIRDALVVAELDDGTRAESRSDAEGRFALALTVAQAWLCHGAVMATRDGLAGASSFSTWMVTSTEHDVGVLVLAATGELQVHVRRGAKSVENARTVAVRAAYSPGMRYASVSDGTGTATLRGLTPGRYCIAATAPDGSWMVGQTDVIAQRTETVVLDLLAATPVLVDVRARDTAAMITNAQLDVLFEIDSESLPAKIPLRLLVPLPRTDDAGRARITGLRRGQIAGVGALHADWRPSFGWNAPRIDWSQTVPRYEVLLDSLDTVTWKLVDGEVAVPPDGTMFTVLETRLPLRDGCLRFDGQPLVSGGGEITAFGPDCYATLRVPDAAAGAATQPAPLQRTRRLVVELRDTQGQPLVGWPLSVWDSRRPRASVRTGSDGRATAVSLPAETVTVRMDARGALTTTNFGDVDLRKGDGFLAVTLSPPRHVRAQVYVDGKPGLPGSLNLRSFDGRIDQVVEDVDRGVLSFNLWCSEPDKPCQVFLDTMPGLSVGGVTIAPGTTPVEVEIPLLRTGSGSVDLLLPADGLCQVRVERFFVQGSGGYWSFAGSVSGDSPRRLWSLHPGRYRLRDVPSDVVGPEVDVAADGADARLVLDLSNVVAARGCVTARAPFTNITIEVRDQAGMTMRRKPVFDDGTFALRTSLDQPGLVLVAVRGTACSGPIPLASAMSDLQLVLPD